MENLSSQSRLDLPAIGDQEQLNWSALPAHLAALASASNLTSAYQIACEGVVAIGFAHAALVLPTKDGTHVHVAGEYPSAGMLNRHLPIRELQAISGITTLDRSWAVPDLALVESPPFAAWLKGSGARSLVWLPLVHASHPRGWLSLHLSRTGASVAEPAVITAQAVAAQMAAVAEHLRLNSELTSLSAEIDDIRRASAGLVAIAARHDGPGGLLDDIVQAAIRTVGAAAGAVYRFSQSASELKLVAKYPDFYDPPNVARINESLADSHVSSEVPYKLSSDELALDVPWLCATLRWQHRLTGVLYVQGVMDQVFTTTDAESLVEFGSQAALALALRARVDYPDETLYDRRGTAVHQTAARILGDLGVKSPDERLHDIAREAAKVLNAEVCQILVACSGDQLELKARFPREGGEAALGHRFKITDEPKGGLSGYIAATKTTFRAHGQDLWNHPSLRRTDEGSASESRCYSLLGIPLLLPVSAGEARFVGLLRLENKRRWRGSASPDIGFSDYDQATGEIVAEAVAQAIAQEDLLRTIREKNEALARQSATLEQVIELQGAPLWQTTQEALFLEVAVRATRVTGYTCAVVYAVDEKQDTVTVVTTHGIATQEGGSREFLDEGFAGRVARAGTIQVVHGTPAPGDGISLGGVEFDAAIGVPLHGASGRVEWVLVVADRSESQPLSDDIRDNLQTFAQSVGRLVQISRLWTWEERSFGQSESLRRVVEFIRTTGDREKLLGALLTGLTADYGLGYNRAVLFLRNAEEDDFEGLYAIGSVSRAEAHDVWEEFARNPIGVDLFLNRLELGELARTPLDERLRGVRLAPSAVPPEWVVAARTRGFATIEPDAQFPLVIGSIFEAESPILFLPILRADQLVGFVLLDNAYLPVNVEDMASDAVKLLEVGAGALYALERGEREEHVLKDHDDLHEVYRQIVQRALRDIFRGSHAALWSYDPASDRFTLRHYEGPDLPPELKWREPQEGKVLRQAREAGWIGLNDINDGAPEFVSDDTQEMLRAIGVRSFQAIALRFTDQSLGVLCVGNTKPFTFVKERDRTIALAFGRRAALVLRQAELLARIRRVRTAAGVLAMVATGVDPEDELQAMASTTLEALGCHTVIVYEYENATGELQLPPTVAVREGSSAALQAALADEEAIGAVDAVLSYSTMHIVEDSSRPETVRSPLENIPGARAYVIIPLWVGAVQVGLLCIAHNDPYRYTAEEQEDVGLFGAQIALFLRNKQMRLELLAEAAVMGIGMVDRDWRHRGASFAPVFEDYARQAIGLLKEGVDGGEITPDLATDLRVLMDSVSRKAASLRDPPVMVGFFEKLEAVRVNEFFEVLSRKRQLEPNMSRITIHLRPEAGDEDAVRVNRQWLEEACDALLTNAEKALRQHSAPEISLFTRRRGRRIELDVVDNGPGLPSIVRQRIGKGPSPSNGGTGSGLFLVQTIAMQYGGRLFAPELPDSTSGTILRVSLPRVDGVSQ